MRVRFIIASLSLLVLIAAATSCTRDKKLFSTLGARETGIDFQNTIVANDTFNALSFEYIYNGSGVGVGDFNNDGLPDLFFGGNQVSSKLYLNKGNLKFEDVTESAGITTNRWITGVSVVDINADGLADVYLSVGGYTTAENRRNLLFVNKGLRDGVPQFIESAKEWGLDSDRYSTMAAFFDYDKDGDLDMYLLNNWLERYNRNNLRPKRVNGEAESTDQLFRNEGSKNFTDVSREAGILIEGYGLGVAICDINEDSWPDVYVANDFMSNDLLWINQQDGTFKNEIARYMKHQTHNGMGVDVADFNNDALADIVVVDMLPPGHERQKMMTPGQNYDHFHMSLESGYEPQYMRNTLQMNRGKMPDGRYIFSEIAFMSGVAQTDWSWAPLFADFDNDGYKDLFVANGYRKDVTNLDFVFFGMENNPFGTPEAKEKLWREKFETVPDVKLANYMFRNTGSLIFEDKTSDWGLDIETFSNGSVYVDLDNDGDLDLVTNNIDQEVIVFENNINKQKERNHFVRLKSSDPILLNEKIWAYSASGVQFIERTPYRGFQSTVEDVVHFGLGSTTKVDSIVIEWIDGARLKFAGVSADTTINYSRSNAKRSVRPHKQNAPLMFEMNHLAGYKHVGNAQSDIKQTRTLMHELSRYGPCIATADVNGDGLDDLFVGGESPSPSMMFIQQADGSFSAKPLNDGQKFSDGYGLFFDADGDGDSDLYVGKAAITGMSSPAQHNLYINDGQGNFSDKSEWLPNIEASASCVEAGDFDGDGDSDLFVGARFKPTAYPFPPRSYILRNDQGKFTDVTEQVCPGLTDLGMISSAAWADINNDGKVDLVVTGEWQPIKVFLNDGSSFSEMSTGLLHTEGWWNCIEAADLNNDGFVDFIVGNTGKNSFFRPTADQPVQIVAKDFDNNGSVDPITTYYNPIEKDRFIVHNRLVLIDQIPAVKKRFETFTQYATRPFSKVFTQEELEGAYIGSAKKLESVILINEGGKQFRSIDLPDIAQLSTINDVIVDDVNGDLIPDIIAVGNMYGQETLFGRYNASLGTILLGDGKFGFSELSATQSGFVADGDARLIRTLNTNRGKVYAISNYNDSIQLFYSIRPNKASVATLR